MWLLHSKSILSYCNLPVVLVRKEIGIFSQFLKHIVRILQIYLVGGFIRVHTLYPTLIYLVKEAVVKYCVYLGLE